MLTEQTLKGGETIKQKELGSSLRQTDNEGEKDLKWKEVQVTTNQIMAVERYDQYEQLSRLRWNENKYRKTFIVKSFLFKANRDTNQVLWGGEERGRDEKIASGLQRIFKDKYWEVFQYEKRINQVSIITKTKDRSGNEMTQNQVLGY